MVDVEIKCEEGKFKYRVCGIVKHDNKYLIQKIEGNNFYCLPGGHVELGENSLDAVKREMKEELGKTTKNEKLVAIMENFFEGKGKVFHEIGFYYLVEVVENLKTEDYTVAENDKGVMKTLEYKWVTKEDLETVDFRPLEIKKIMINPPTELQHIIFKD